MGGAEAVAASCLVAQAPTEFRPGTQKRDAARETVAIQFAMTSRHALSLGLLSFVVGACGGDDGATTTTNAGSDSSSGADSSGGSVTMTSTTVADSSTSDSTTMTSTTATTTGDESSSGGSESGGSSSGGSDSSGGSSSGGSESSSGGAVLDADGDTILDDTDNCVVIFNPDQSDIDLDGVGDFCDDEMIDDGVTLYIPVDAVVDLGGLLCYTQVQINGTLHVPAVADDGAGTLVILADRVALADGGVIDAEGAGPLGGAPSQGVTLGGFVGDGVGGSCGGGPGNSVGQGGTGGTYGGLGGAPGDVYAVNNACDLCSEATIAHCEGAAGSIYDSDDGIDISVGSGGGAGGNSSGCSGAGGRGGHGGGGVAIVANEWVHIDGVVLVGGETPPGDTSPCGFHPGGGGGSGGGLLIAAPEIAGAASGVLNAHGGNGGDSPGDVSATWGWGGGGGGGGRVKLFADTNTFAGVVDVGGGAGGLAPGDSNSAVGLPGDDGFVGGDSSVPPEFMGVVCPG